MILKPINQKMQRPCIFHSMKNYYKNMLVFMLLILLFIKYMEIRQTSNQIKNHQKSLFDSKDQKIIEYNESPPLVFLSGSPKSGLNLMQSILASKVSLLTTAKTKFLLEFLSFNSNHVIKNGSETRRLEKARIYSDTVNSAAKQFILKSILAFETISSEYLVIKEFAFGLYIEYLSSLFKDSKFILMIRDGRSVAASNIKKSTSDVNYEQELLKWNELNEIMYSQCMLIGAQRCIPVYYEELIIDPERVIKKLSSFLNISLHQTTKILLNNSKSTKLNSNWIGRIPEKDLKDIDEIAPILQQLGYDTKNSSSNDLTVKKFEECTKQNQLRNSYWTKVIDFYFEIIMAYRIHFKVELK